MRYAKSGRSRTVVDTNVFISGLLGSGATSRLITYLWEGLFQLVLSPDIFREYARVTEVLQRISAEDADAFLKNARKVAWWVDPKVIPDICSDPSDNIFLACAEEAEADFLVTKNTKHFPKKSYKEVRIVRIGAFLRAIGK